MSKLTALITIIGLQDFGTSTFVHLEEEIRKCVTKNNHSCITRSLIGPKITKQSVINILNELIDNVNKFDKVIIYYFGHGDQMRDVSGDESDGKDEFWKLFSGERMIDDELTQLFNKLKHNLCHLLIISDCCSSGSMIDDNCEFKNWVTIGSCTDSQSALAGSDIGGVFTEFGFIPAILQHNARTVEDLNIIIPTLINIPTQHMTTLCGNKNELSIQFF